MKCLAIIGASGHGKVIADIALLTGWESIVFFDDAFPTLSSLESWEVRGDTRDFINTASAYDGVVIAIGDNKTRLSLYHKLNDIDCNIVSLIHPKATISHFSSIGYGTVVMAGSVVSSCAVIGDVCIINSNSIVEHDCVLSDGVHLSPLAAIAGGCKIGKRSWIGIGAVVKQQLHIAENVIVGAGGVVINDLSSDNTYIGIPARILLT